MERSSEGLPLYPIYPPYLPLGKAGANLGPQLLSSSGGNTFPVGCQGHGASPKVPWSVALPVGAAGMTCVTLACGWLALFSPGGIPRRVHGPGGRERKLEKPVFRGIKVLQGMSLSNCLRWDELGGPQWFPRATLGLA